MFYKKINRCFFFSIRVVTLWEVDNRYIKKVRKRRTNFSLVCIQPLRQPDEAQMLGSMRFLKWGMRIVMSDYDEYNVWNRDVYGKSTIDQFLQIVPNSGPWNSMNHSGASLQGINLLSPLKCVLVKLICMIDKKSVLCKTIQIFFHFFFFFFFWFSR